MSKVTLRDLEIAGSRLLVRVDFDVPLRPNFTMADDRRIRAALPSINFARQAGASVVLLSHLGSPCGRSDPCLSQVQVAHRLQQLLPNAKVHFLPDTFGIIARQRVETLAAGDVLLLENLRFHPGEESGEETFAHELAQLGNLYINDAFAESHRRDASLFALPLCFAEQRRAIGFLVERELDKLDAFLEHVQPPWIVILGGVKVEDDLALIEALADRVDHFLLGGAIAYTLLHTLGVSIGQSPIDETLIERGRKLLATIGEKLLLPVDHVMTRASAESDEPPLVAQEIPDDWRAVDLGPETVASYCRTIERAHTAIWHGPLGSLAPSTFTGGSEAIARALVARGAHLLAGGEETSRLLRQFNLAGRFEHLSSGGSALLRYLAERQLAALSVIGELQAA